METPAAPNSPLSAPMKMRTPSDCSASSSSLQHRVLRLQPVEQHLDGADPLDPGHVGEQLALAAHDQAAAEPAVPVAQVASPASTTWADSSSNWLRSSAISVPTMLRSSASVRPDSRALR